MKVDITFIYKANLNENVVNKRINALEEKGNKVIDVQIIAIYTDPYLVDQFIVNIKYIPLEEIREFKLNDLLK